MSAPHDEPVDEPCVYLTRNGAMSPAVCHAFLDWREAPVAPRPSEAELSFLDPVRMRCFSSSPYPARLRCLSSAPYLAMPDPCRYTRKQRAGAAQATSGGVLGAYALSSSENEEEEVHPPVALVADIEEGEIVEVTPVHSVGVSHSLSLSLCDTLGAAHVTWQGVEARGSPCNPSRE